jgi:drug/metabolite transporter (DMT)-like permease
MKSAFVSHVLIITCVLALATGQVLFKALSLRTTTLLEILSDRVSLVMFFAAMSIYAASTLLWIIALRNVPLSYAYMFMAAGFVLVPVAAHLIFDEPLSPRFVVGALLIALGVWIVAA